MADPKPTLHFLLRAKPSTTTERDEQEVQSKEGFSQYEVKDEGLGSIWYRVVCINVLPDGKKAPTNSLLGPDGHLERMNVWSHSTPILS